MTTAAIISRPNTANLDQPGHVDWSHGAPDGEATAAEHEAALRSVGAGWHSIHTLWSRGRIGGAELFRLLRADFARYAGDDAAGDPVYLVLF